MIAVTALVLALLELVFLAAVVVLIVRTWSRVREQVTPLLAMFAPPPAGSSTTSSSGGEPGSSITGPR